MFNFYHIRSMDEEQFETTAYRKIDSELLSAGICNSYACDSYKTMSCIYTVEDYGVVIAAIQKVMYKFYGHNYPFSSSNGGMIDSNLDLASDMRSLGKWREGANISCGIINLPPPIMGLYKANSYFFNILKQTCKERVKPPVQET